MKTIEELRKEFEQTKTFKLCYSWMIDFDEVANTYYAMNIHLHSDVTSLNSAWLMFQELKNESQD